MNFTELSNEYNTVVNRVSFEARFPGLPLADQVLMHKLQKHYRTSNYRHMAHYIATYLHDFGTLPQCAKDLAIAAGKNLKPGKGEIGYLHSDGSYHWFTV